MSFKDQIKQDLSDIFLNLDEFADLHRIEGKEVPVVIDSDIMAKLSKIGDNRIPVSYTHLARPQKNDSSGRPV